MHPAQIDALYFPTSYSITSAGKEQGCTSHAYYNCAALRLEDDSFCNYCEGLMTQDRSEAQLMVMDAYRTTLEPQNQGYIAGDHFLAVIQPPKHVRPCKVTHEVLMVLIKCRAYLSLLIQSVP